MTQEEKDLLLKDLCARLQYGVIVQVNDGIKGIYDRRLVQVFCDRLSCSVNVYNPLEECICIDSVKPYLRPMSSMTEEEKEKLLAKLPTKWNIEIDKFEDFYFDICEECAPDIELFTDIIDWLNKKMFDYRGLIPKDCAIAVTKENNPYNDIKD